MIKLEITADNADELFAQLYGLAGKNAPTMTKPVGVTVAEHYGDPELASDNVEEAALEPTEKKRRGRPAKVKTDVETVDTGTTEAGGETLVEATVTSETVAEAESVQVDTVEETAEDDEFAAFAAAAKETETVAEVVVTARKWSDADLGALCNQAATKLSDPAPVKEIITQFVPEGEVSHSRNVPAEYREAFARAIEAKAGIEFAG